MAQHNKQDTTSPVVWLLTDNKPGHRNQLKGLGNRLKAIAGVSLFWVDAAAVKVPLWRVLLAAAPPAPELRLPHPDLVIAAGSRTHRLLLSLRRLRRTKTLVMMKPGFPVSLISGAIIPAHDNVAASSKVFVTEGAVNTVTPLAKITEKPSALLLIGGPSRHFEWEDDVILGQISDLISYYPGWLWTISTSRRTPAALQARLEELAGPQVSIFNPQQTHDTWLSQRLAASRAVWVTPDSMSMVCEAATSGVPTGLFELRPKKSSTVADGINRLTRAGYVSLWQDHASVMAGKSRSDRQLWDANCAAKWVLEKGMLPTNTDKNHGSGSPHKRPVP